MTSYERELGRLQSDMENANENIKRVEGKIDEHAKLSLERHDMLEKTIAAEFKKIEALLNEGRGAWKVIIFVAGIAGSVATLFATKILTILSIIK